MLDYTAEYRLEALKDIAEPGHYEDSWVETTVSNQLSQFIGEFAHNKDWNFYWPGFPKVLKLRMIKQLIAELNEYYNQEKSESSPKREW